MPAENKSSEREAPSLHELQQRIPNDPWNVFVECEQLLRQAADLALEALGDIESKLIAGMGEDEEAADAILRLLSNEVSDSEGIESFELALIALERRRARYTPISSQPSEKEPIAKKKVAKKKVAKEKVAKKPAANTTPDELDKGSRVRIIKGKDGIGVEGEIFWWGDSKFGDNMRAGVRGDDGETYWVDDWALELA